MSFLNTLKAKMWLARAGIHKYTINPDGTIDVHQSVELDNNHTPGILAKGIPVQFGVVMGDFTISFNSLESLKGCPHTVHGNFACEVNQLKSLEGGPTIVDGAYNCSRNHLRNFEGGPEFVKGGFQAEDNPLSSLKGSPKTVGEYFNCASEDATFTTLEGAPSSIGGNFLIDILNPNLKSLTATQPVNIQGPLFFTPPPAVVNEFAVLNGSFIFMADLECKVWIELDTYELSHAHEILQVGTADSNTECNLRTNESVSDVSKYFALKKLLSMDLSGVSGPVFDTIKSIQSNLQKETQKAAEDKNTVLAETRGFVEVEDIEI